MTEVKDAMIVAGGEGTRLQPLTSTTPKPLLEFCGAPFLTGVIRRLARVGVERVLLIVGARVEPFDVLREDADRLGVEMEVVPEPEPLDTAGGVRAALHRVRGTFLVLNGDILTDVDLERVLAAHRRRRADATIVLARVEDTSAYGVCVRDGTRIVDFVEKPTPGTLEGHDTVNAGTYVLEPDALGRFPLGRLSFERTVFPRLVADDARVEGVVSDAVWADIGTPSRFLAGHRLALDGAVAWPLLEGLEEGPDGVLSSRDVDVEADVAFNGPVLLCPGARLAGGATVGPYVVVGPGASIDGDVRVSHSVLFSSSELKAPATRLLAGRGARIGADVRLGRDVVVGDGVTLEPGSQLEDGARVPSTS